MDNIKECVKLSQLQVTDIVRELSEKLFNKKFTLPVKYNMRLRKTYASFNYLKRSRKPLYIECSNDIYCGEYKLETVISILVHELCHWWLFINDEPSGDKDYTFKKLVRSFGGTLTGEVSPSGQVYEYKCSKCGKVLARCHSNRYQKSRYVSNCCKEKLICKYIFAKDENEINLKFDPMELESIRKLFNNESIKQVAIKNNIKEVIQNNSVNSSDEIIDFILQPRKSMKYNFEILEKSKQVILPTKTGITNYSLFIAIKFAIANKLKENLMQIKENYGENFAFRESYENVLKNLPAKQWNIYNELIKK